MTTIPFPAPNPILKDIRLAAHASRLALAAYYHAMKYRREAIGPWRLLSSTRKQEFIDACAELLRDVPPMCIYCNRASVMDGSEYCSTMCSRSAERS